MKKLCIILALSLGSCAVAQGVASAGLWCIGQFLDSERHAENKAELKKINSGIYDIKSAIAYNKAQQEKLSGEVVKKDDIPVEEVGYGLAGLFTLIGGWIKRKKLAELIGKVKPLLKKLPDMKWRQ